MRMQMDDKTFQASLLDTQVMLTKDHTKWSFETLQELVEGPLHNPKRMEEAIKVSRYIRRLMSFFHPFAHRFSDLPRTKVDRHTGSTSHSGRVPHDKTFCARLTNVGYAWDARCSTP